MKYKQFAEKRQEKVKGTPYLFNMIKPTLIKQLNIVFVSKTVYINRKYFTYLRDIECSEVYETVITHTLHTDRGLTAILLLYL